MSSFEREPRPTPGPPVRVSARCLSRPRMLHLVCAPLLALSLMGAEKARITCPVSGLAETDAELSLTRTGGRMVGFTYYMFRPVNRSWHECEIYAVCGHPESFGSTARSGQSF